MMSLLVRHLARHWRLNLATLACLTLASALLASLSGYATSISAEVLDQSLEAAGAAERSLLIVGNLDTFGGELSADLHDRLGKLWQDRLVIRHARLPADPQPSSQTTEGKRTVVQLDVYSFDKLAENVRLVEGKLPAQVSLSESAGYWPPPVEAVIGRQAAEESGYAVGDRLSASGLYHRLDIAGIVEPLDPHDDLWGDDLSAFAVAEEPGPDAIALPLIIAPESMQSYLGRPLFPHDVSWRISLDRQRMGPAMAGALYANLVSFQTQSATRGAVTSSGLLRILEDFLARLARLRVAIWMLASQSAILVLYALAVFSSFAVDRLHAEVAILSARGASVWQITRTFALEGLFLALPAALLLGPGLGQGAVHLWSRATGSGLPDRLSGGLWLLSTATAGLGWLVLVLSIWTAARRCSRDPEPRNARPAQRSALHRHHVDLYLLAFGGLLVWQLNQSGSFLARAIAGSRLGNTPLADPLLLLGPFVLLIAAAMVFLRVVPILLRLVARPFQSQRGVVLSLGLLRAARNPLHASRLVLLVSLATGMVLFARTLSDSVASGRESLRPDPWIQGTVDTFQLNAPALVLFSAVMFILVSWLATQGHGGGRGRVPELHVLRALGLPPRQQPMLRVIEGAVVLLVGLLTGAAVGFGLSYTMIPYLSQALIEPLGGVAIAQIVVDWSAVSRLYAVLTVANGSALAFLWFVLGRERAQRALWREDE
jgi:putative ABC transport system permease protein